MCIWLINTHLAQFWARQHGRKVTCWCLHCLQAVPASRQAVCAYKREAGKWQSCHLHRSRQQTPMMCPKMEPWLWQPSWAPIPTPVSRQRLTVCRHYYAGDESHLFVTCGNSFCSWLRKPAGGVCRAARGPLKTKSRFQFPLKSNLLQ